MEKYSRQLTLDVITEIYEKSRDYQLDKSFYERCGEPLKYLCSYFKVNEIQAVLIAVGFVLTYRETPLTINFLAEHFGCPLMKILQIADELVDLHNKGILQKKRVTYSFGYSYLNDYYVVNNKICQAVLAGQSIPAKKIELVQGALEFLEYLSNLEDYFRRELKESYEIAEEFQDLLEINRDLPLVKMTRTFNLNFVDTYIYLLLIWESLTSYKSINIWFKSECILESSVERIRYQQEFISGKNALLVANLVKTSNSTFVNDTEICLTEKSYNLLNDIGINIFLFNNERSSLIKSIDIAPNKLIFSDFEEKQINSLHQVLLDVNFKHIQMRLQEKGYPKGITVLLYGLPGTGKTEAVLQLARATNRDVIKVDFSKIKSMWFGESEKNVKDIFTEYKLLVSKARLMPILLFNEADALISKRRDISDSNVIQTENAIQNLLLEELENFEGILFATTNLIVNIDSAFDRRFLFKLELSKPDRLAQAKIWKLKLPELTDRECEILSERFDFTGGEIDNVVRKANVNEIINGEQCIFSDIIEFCNTEQIRKRSFAPVGFLKS